MRTGPAPGTRSRIVFQIVALAALVAAFAQVSLGGVVRVTGSGLGCPDWPLCHGRLIPPMELATLIEYSHRLSASLVGVLVLATMVLAWRLYRSQPWVFLPSVAALVLVVAAAALGGVTVLTDLAWSGRLAHLAIAEFLVASMVVVSVASWKASRASLASEVNGGDTSGLNLLVAMATVGVFALIISGSYMVGQGAGSSCGSWPLCQGAGIPAGEAYATHMAHRVLATLVGLLIVATAVVLWSRRTRSPGTGPVAVALAAVFAAQVLIGAATVWTGFSAELKAVHLSVATLVWVMLTLVVALLYVPAGFRLTRVETTPTNASRLGKLAS